MGYSTKPERHPGLLTNWPFVEQDLHTDAMIAFLPWAIHIA